MASSGPFLDKAEQAYAPPTVKVAAPTARAATAATNLRAHLGRCSLRSRGYRTRSLLEFGM